MLVPILLGSESDKEFAGKITQHFDTYGIPYEIVVSSAHKVPEKLLQHIKKYDNCGEDIVYITIAGRSNGLSGVTAANSCFPVVACPPHQDKDDFTVNINSTLMMPSDTPVLTVCDPQNCAMAVMRIFGMKNEEIRAKVEQRMNEIKGKFSEA
ncbi:MAG: 5-(carboxyamino)imidazole ribonucleotide mutase [Candidatus Peregrinibacteria bacterium]|nr:5-(carboxyamino)imidazole ribonucleotide mutase [Candidatus Peregrinibacteria bacterium]MDZ4245102.1 AIR carboxylase family protein [Candidatus Gracilibacteria bacterium]